jgi:hypothetical protein
MLGAGPVIEKLTTFDVPPPDAGVNTVTAAVPAEARSLAGMAAWSWLLFKKVVARSEPFQRTIEVAAKSLPITVSVKELPPTTPLPGESARITGAGLAGGPPVPVTLRDTLPAFDVKLMAAAKVPTTAGLNRTVTA